MASRARYTCVGLTTSLALWNDLQTCTMRYDADFSVPVLMFGCFIGMGHGK